MATATATTNIPKVQTLITVNEFRDLVKKHFEKQLADGTYDPRDIERFNTVDEYALMFVQHGQFTQTFNQERALNSFDGSMSWRKRHIVYDIAVSEFPAELLNRHGIYFANVDRFGHRILHVAVRKLEKGKDDNEMLKRFITFHLEQHLREHTGEKLVMLFDMSGAGISNLDYDLTKYIISSLQVFYPRILAYMLMYKMPFLLWAAWKLIKTWMSPDAEQFVKFVDNKTIQEYVAPDQLSASMGGTAPDQN